MDIASLISSASALEQQIAEAAIAAGRGPAGLALNVAKTQVSLAIGQLLRGQSAVGSG